MIIIDLVHSLTASKDYRGYPFILMAVRMFGLTYLGLPMIILVTSFLNLATAKVLYITPSTSDLCTTQCLTISELAANTSSYISSNTTLVFTAGTHHLIADLTVSDVNNVSITSNGSYTAIVCMHHSYIT